MVETNREYYLTAMEILLLITSIISIFYFVKTKKIIFLLVSISSITIATISNLFKYEIYDKLVTNGCGYRIGDMIKGESFRKEIGGANFHLKLYPDSIVSEYLNETRDLNNYEILNSIVKKRMEKINFQNIENKILFHLRTGDEINRYSEKELKNILEVDNRYLKSKKTYLKIIDKLPDIKYIVLFSSVKSGGNTKKHHDVSKSYKYIDDISKIFEEKGFIVEKRINQDADEDFTILSNGHHFIPTGGGYSQHIKELINYNGKNVYE